MMLSTIASFFRSNPEKANPTDFETQLSNEEATCSPANKSGYKWDQELIYDRNFGKKFNKDKYQEDLASKLPFPKDELLAKFAVLAYQDQGYRPPDDWELLTTAHNESYNNGYFGVAFWNSKLHHVVVAHRGTAPQFHLKLYGIAKADVQLAFNKEKTDQAQSAATFVHLVSEEIKRKIKEDDIRIQLSITGHSLGAWLAQITTFTVKYFKVKNNYFIDDNDYLNNIHAHTVVFDSPGCKQTLTKIVQRFLNHRYTQRKFGNYYTLDMTVYLHEPNFINCVNEHVGTIYRTSFFTHSIPDSAHNSDTSKIEKEIALDFPLGKRNAIKLFFKRIAWLLPANEDIPTEPYNENEHSLNVFSEHEREFINWISAIKTASSNTELPTFEIHFDRNVIGSNNLTETIGIIKHLQPKKEEILFTTLQEDTKDAILHEKLKCETDEYRKGLKRIQDYYFKDVLHFDRFLKSEKRLLHIHANIQASIELEMSILNNIFKYYHNHYQNTANSSFYEKYFKSGQYGFLSNWNQLNDMIQSNTFSKRNINLLIIESCNRCDIECIRQLLEVNETIKIITISAESWKDSDVLDNAEIEEVAGLSNNITFDNLTEDSQETLKTEKKVIFLGNVMNLNDIIETPSSLRDEHLLELLLRPIEEKIEIQLQVNTFLNAVYFVDVHHIIKPEIFEENIINYDDELTFIIEDATNSGLCAILESTIPKSNRLNLKVASKVDFEMECYNLKKFKKVAYLFVIRNQEFILTRIYNNDFYIPRYVRHVKCVTEEIFKSKDNDFYYFCGDENYFNNKTANLKDEEMERLQFIPSEEKARKIVEESEENAHLFKIENNQIFWLYSNKEIKFLHKYISLEENLSIRENVLMNEENVTIISGNAGEGKSSAIGYLLEYYRKEKNWVFAITLNRAAFEEIQEKVNFRSASKFILKSCNISVTRFVEYMLSYCLKYETKLSVCLLFDAFDEIHEDSDRKQLIKLIQFLKRKSSAKILITTRKFRCEELENKLSVFASEFKTSDYKAEKKQFFLKFWYTQARLFRTNHTQKQAEDYLETMFEDVENVLRKTIADFKATPLYLRMIAEIYTPLFINNRSREANNEEENNKSIGILELYRKYIDTHCNIYFKRTECANNEVQQLWLQDSIFKKLRELAVITLNGLEPQNSNLKELQELNKVGLIHFQNNRLDFIHESIRDYFISNVLELWLQSYYEPSHNNWDIEKFIVSDLFMKPELRETRHFFNYKIGQLKLSNNHLLSCKRLLEGFEESTFINNNNESIFHICIAENLYLLLKHLLFEIIPENKKSKLLSLRNLNLETPLFLAISNIINSPEDDCNKRMLITLLDDIYEWSHSNIKVVLLATLFTNFVNTEHINVLTTNSSVYTGNKDLLKKVILQYQQIQRYFEACKEGSVNQLKEVLNYFKDDDLAKSYLLLTKNERKETGLHIAKDIAIAKLLLALEIDKNSQDVNGMTALNRCVKDGRKPIIKKQKTQIAKLLIQNGADPTLPDNMGNITLIHAAKYDNLSVVETLLNSPDTDVDYCNYSKVTALMVAVKHGCKSVVNILLRQGAEVNAVDKRGQSAAHRLVRYNNTDLVRILKNGNADLNIDDRDGITPLLLSIQNGRYNLANSLVDNGADVIKHSEEIERLLRTTGHLPLLNKIINIRERQWQETNAVDNVTEQHI